MTDAELARLFDVSETLLVPLYARATATRDPDPILRDPRAVALFDALQDELARSDTRLARKLLKGRFSPKLVATLAWRARRLDRYATDFLAASPGGRGGEPRLRAGHPVLPPGPRRLGPLVRPGPAAGGGLPVAFLPRHRRVPPGCGLCDGAPVRNPPRPGTRSLGSAHPPAGRVDLLRRARQPAGLPELVSRVRAVPQDPVAGPLPPGRAGAGQAPPPDASA